MGRNGNLDRLAVFSRECPCCFGAGEVLDEYEPLPDDVL
jgi:hypothetical protein